MHLTKEINPNIFREYDIRAIADKELSSDVAYTIGRSFGSYIQENNKTKAIVGHDNRLTSSRLSEAIIKGLTESGIDVIDLGLVTTPMYYFARIHYKTPAGIMITASHNPKEYNGFKISFNEIGNAYGKLIKDFKDYTFTLNFREGNGKVEKKDIKKAYLNNIKNSIKLGDRKIKVAIDCGNGTGSVIIKDILDLFDIDYNLLYCTSDPNFPNHTPDPAVSKNMIDLGKKVKEIKADFGIGIDGDADRVGVVDENGNYLTADLVMLIIYRNILNQMKNKTAIFDVKCSRTLIDGIKELNLKPIMNRTGNPYCNLKMQSENLDFGGEYSGHFFFRDKYQGFDDGIYAGLRLIEILSKTNKNFSELLDNINKYVATEEIIIKVTEENKFAIVDGVINYVKEKGYKYEDIDGIRIEFDDSWALIRASNTGPNLTVRYEAKTEDRLQKIQNEFQEIINDQIKIHS